MVTNQRQTIRQRIKSRMKGLAALLLAVALAVGMMPAVEARADDPDNYYLIAFLDYYNGILCKGTETMTGIPANQTAFGPWNGNTTGTYYVNYSNGGLAVRDGSTFTEVGKIGSATPSQTVDLEVSEATNFYFGTTSGYQFYIEVKLDGVSQGTSTGVGDSGKASFNIPVGKYTVQHTSSENYRKHIVDIKTVITELVLSKTSLEFTVGDPAQQLTVQPDTAKVKWSSSNPNVASVDDSGKVTPVGVGNADITVALQTDENVKATCKVNVKAKEKPAATVDKAPTARTLTYTGSAQELVTAGEATGGEMQYAIGENATTVPTSGWSRSIPTGIEVKTYYVWYKVKGDDIHSDSKAASVESTIKGKDTPEIKNDSTLPEAEQDKEYSVKLELKDTTVQNMDWTVTDSSLPEGLSLDSKTGVISGTPTKAGEYAFTIKEKTSGAEKKFSLTVKSKGAPEIKNDSTLPEAEKDKEYSVKLELKDTTVQNADWSVTDGSMPEGLSLDSKTGVISGTPTKAGEYAFTIKEKTSDAEKKFSLTVKSKGGPEIKNDSTLPEAEQDKEYSVTLELNDSTVKDTDWAVTDGTLPEGLSLDSKTGKISGTPSKAGKYEFTAKEKNTGAEKEFTINVKTSSSTIDTKGDVGLDAVQSEENLQVLEGSVDNLSEEEQQKVKEAKEQGKDLAYEFETEGLNEDDAEGAPEIKDYNNEKGLTMGKVFDISLLIKVKDTGDTLGKMRRLNGKVKFAVSIPEEFRSEGRTFYILRFHDKVDEVGKGQGDEVEAESDLFSTYAISYTDSEDPAPDKKKSKSHKKDDSEEHKTASWILNPNEKQQLVITYTGTPAYLTAGYQEQGAAATELFKAAVPAGWVKAFSFNVLDQKRQPELSVKNGIMVLYIPGEYIKANRQFALLGMNKAGQVILFSDTDQNPNTVTVNLANMDGYAFELIYKD